MEEKIHYICTGTCGGVSEELKACGAEDCPKHGKMLVPCDCRDGSHDNREEKNVTEDEK